MEFFVPNDSRMSALMAAARMKEMLRSRSSWFDAHIRPGMRVSEKRCRISACMSSTAPSRPSTLDCGVSRGMSQFTCAATHRAKRESDAKAKESRRVRAGEGDNQCEGERGGWVVQT